MDLFLPYKVGDLAESRTFLEGYRGAWFRCKIDDMRVAEEGHFECYLEYIDYPGENKEWIRLYQKNPGCSEQQPSEQIMIRPSFPQWYWKDQIPEQLPDNDVVATVSKSWKIGDLVDWLSEGCYWSGKITKFLGEDMFYVELHKPPIGEGQYYPANRKDLRPTLDWSLAGGWTVPLSQVKGKSWHVARVIHRKTAESETSDSNAEESDSGDEYNDGGDDDDDDDDDDSQDVQLPMNSPNTSQEAPGPQIPNSSSATNSMFILNSQDAILTSTANLKPSSPSKPPAPSHGTQPAVTSSLPGPVTVEQEPGTGSFIKQEQGSSPPEREAGDVQDQYLQKLDQVEGNLRKLIELTQSEEALLASLRRWIPEDASAKKV